VLLSPLSCRPEKLRFIETTKLEGTVATNANYLVYFEDGVLLGEGISISLLSKWTKSLPIYYEEHLASSLTSKRLSPARRSYSRPHVERS